MGVVFKHVLKNVFGKPGRTLLVLICLTISSFVALMTFDMSGAMKNLFVNLYSSFFGDADIIVNGITENRMRFFDDEEFPENTTVYMYAYSDTYYTRVEGEYDVIESHSIHIMAFNFEEASELGIFESDIELVDNQVYMSEEMAEDFGFEEGDTIILHDINDEEVEFEVAKIQDMGKGLLSGDVVVMSLDSFRLLNPSAKANVAAINIKDDSLRKGATELLDEKYPDVAYEYLFEDPEMEEMINSITQLFFLLLAVCLMMVFFVTISVSDRIVCERMSVIGTLRSLGFTSGATTVILLLENVTYGLIGGTLGCLLYSAVRDTFLGLLVTTTGDVTVDFGHVNPVSYLLVIIGAIAIEILCSIKETVKAVNIPVRDIIFNTKDTSYKHSRGNTIIGLISLLVAIVCLFFKKVFACQVITLVLGEIAIAMLVPYAIIFLANLLRKHFEKKGKIVPTLASAEVATKKNTVGAGVLIATVSALAVILLSFTQAFQDNFSKFEFPEADVILSVNGCDDVNFRYLENLPEVDSVEYQRSFFDPVLINGEEYSTMSTVYQACPNEEGWSGNDCFKGMETNLAENEICVTDDVAKDLELEVGDVITVTFLSEYYIPIERDMTVKGIWHTKTYSYGFEINYDFYHNLYGDDISSIYVMTDDPEGVKEKALKYSGTFLLEDTCYTHDEYIAEMEGQASGILAVISFVLILGIVITFVGAAGNLLLGFESRKRECAVLLSTSFTRKQLKKVFFLESFIVSGLSLLIAYPLGAMLIYPLSNAFVAMETALELKFNPVPALLLFIGMWFVFTLTALKPNRALSKMKLAEQLKYE